jgi:uncharacterized membrane protein YgcG
LPRPSDNEGMAPHRISALLVATSLFVGTTSVLAQHADATTGPTITHRLQRVHPTSKPNKIVRQPQEKRGTLTVRLIDRRFVVGLATHSRGRVAFVVDGHRVAVRRRPPYAVALRREPLLRALRHRIVARDAHTGARLATRVLLLSSEVRRRPRVSVSSAPAASSTSTTATITWTSASATSTTCSLDHKRGVPCSSPANFAVAIGSHDVRITVTNKWGSASASADFTIVPPPAPPGGDISSGASGGTSAGGSASPPGGTSIGGGGDSTGAATSPSGAAETTSTIAPPLPPAPYQLPAAAIYVTSSDQLVTALQNSNRDIVLADGTYSRSSPFVDSGGDRLYAEHLGGAVLQTGLVVGGNVATGGALVRGLVFDIHDASRVLGGGALHIWGLGGANTQVLDCVFRGNWAVPVGILAYNPLGLHVERVELSSFTDVGVRASDNVQTAYGSATPHMDVLQDISIDGVSRAVPGSSNGTAEAGLWIGEPVQNGVHRVSIRNVAWSGIETVNNAWDTSFTDLDIDMSGSRQAQGVGVYLEHYSRHLTFDHFSLRGVRVGVNAEWADPAYASIAGAHFIDFTNGVIDSVGSTLSGNQAGIFLDVGTESVTVKSVFFRNQNWAAIAAYQTIGTNSFTQLTSQLQSSASVISNAHI